MEKRLGAKKNVFKKISTCGISQESDTKDSAISTEV